NVLRRMREVAATGERFEALQRRLRQVETAATTVETAATTRHLEEQQDRLFLLQRAADILAIGAGSYYLGSMIGAWLDVIQYTPVSLNDNFDALCELAGRTCVAIPVGDAEMIARDAEKLNHLLGFLVAFPFVIILRLALPAILRRRR